MQSTTAFDALTRSNVHISGHGQHTVVLLPCFGGNQSMWEPLLPALEQHHRVVSMDLVGCGGSDTSAYSWERHGSLMGHVQDLLDVLRALHLCQVTFIGHSLGAIIGVLAAIKAPEHFASLVLISPSPRFLNGVNYCSGYERADIDALLTAMETDFSGWAHAFAPAVVGPDGRPELLLSFTNSFVQSNPEIVRHFAGVAFMADLRADLPLLTIPALIVQSARDTMAPLAVGQYLNEQLTNSHIVVIDTGGHCPHLTAPEQTMAAIEEFLHCELMEPVPVEARNPGHFLRGGY